MKVNDGGLETDIQAGAFLAGLADQGKNGGDPELSWAGIIAIIEALNMCKYTITKIHACTVCVQVFQKPPPSYVIHYMLNSREIFFC